MRRIKIIDLFSGAGGFSEGFMQYDSKIKKSFDIILSVEKDNNAIETLKLRKFFHMFSEGNVPDLYYDVLRENDINKRRIIIDELYLKFNHESSKANEVVKKLELGSVGVNKKLDDIVQNKINKGEDWILVGGPPCQAFSIAGRSRVGGIKDDDHRVYLYKEYLRMIAKHHPKVFVMENVKGLLSAKVNGESMFDKILEDLKNPSGVFDNIESKRYKIFSLSNLTESFDVFGNPTYKDNLSYLIKSEKYSIPQNRHRVILLGVREDVDKIPDILLERKEHVDINSVIENLPIIRSKIGREYCGEKDGKKIYKKSQDSDECFDNMKSEFSNELKLPLYLSSINYGFGGEFIPYKLQKNNKLDDWYSDLRIGGVVHHISRSHMLSDLRRYYFSSVTTKETNRFPRTDEFSKYDKILKPNHKNIDSKLFNDRYRVQRGEIPSTTITSHISKDGHYYIHPDPSQCRSFTVREASRIQTFPDNYLFCGSRTSQFHQVGNAVPPYLSYQIADIVFKLLNDG